MVANQKRITINKEICNASNPYLLVNLEALQQAMFNLKKVGTFKLWMYLASNQNGFSLELSGANCKKWGIRPDSYHVAVRELVDLGYLVEQKNNHYIFYEVPLKTENQ